MLAKTIEIAKVQTDADLKAVGQFRYKCYTSEGLIDPQEDKCFLDEYDYARNAQIFIVWSAGRIVGTMRLHILDRDAPDSATMTAFSDVLMPKIDDGFRLIDGARFAVEPELGSMRLGVARHTLRLYESFAAEQKADFGVAAVQEERIEFYQRLWGFHQIAAPREYGNLNKKLALVGVDLRKGQ